MTCPRCGRPVPLVPVRNLRLDRPNGGVALLSFICPLLGVALWRAWATTWPLRATSARWGATAGVFAALVAISLWAGRLGTLFTPVD